MKHLPYWIFVLLILLSACSDDNGAKPDPDATPPARVQGLTFQDSTGYTVTLSWMAPGDDGMAGRAALYDIRYSMNLLSEAGWDSATIADLPPVPKPAGQVESLSVSGLPDGTWHFGLKAADEVLNWSAMSNIVSTTLVDTIPPGQVTDLTAVFATTASVELNWTAPGDDGDEGGASEYDLRYALAPITEETWDEAFRVEDVPAPDSAGSPESYTVMGLEPETTYSFALKAIDDVLNWSELSNAVNRLTAYVVRLTFSPDGPPWSGARRPIWSPAGRNIVFRADWGDDNYNTELYLISASGGEPEQLTYDPDTMFGACWSRDGTQIAFVSARTHYTEIYIMDAVPGAAPVQLTSFQGEKHITDLIWSPNGSHFAYIHSPWPGPNTEMYIVPYAGGTSQLVAGGSRMQGGLAWSPDGTQIAFVSNRTGNREIWAIPASGGWAVQLTTDPANDSGPAWSPDGSQIAFVSNRAGDYDLWLMSSAGENLTQLTFDPANEGRPSWSPDGRRIAFSSSENGASDIWILVLE